MTPLAQRRCTPCPPGTPPLAGDALPPLLAELDGWSVVDGHHLEKTFRLRDFAAALDLVNRIGAIAEEQDHHPDIFLAWGQVRVCVWTHTIDGLAEGDFVLAAKCDAAFAAMPS